MNTAEIQHVVAGTKDGTAVRGDPCRAMMRPKKGIKRIILGSGLSKTLSRLMPPSVLVLRYHSVKDNPSRHADYAGRIVHSTESFERQMRFISKECVPVSIEDIRYYAANGAAPPNRAMAVTFDDGYADNLHNAGPIMNRYGIKGTVYVTMSCALNGRPPWFLRLRSAFSRTAIREWWDRTSNTTFDLRDSRQKYQAFLAAGRSCARLSGEDLEQEILRNEAMLGVERLSDGAASVMTPDEMRELVEMGHIIGSHTMTHPNLAHLNDDDLRWELCESKRVLEEVLDSPVEHFSYPKPILWPYHTDRTRNALKEAGYRTAVTCNPGVFREDDDALSIARIAVPEDVDDFRWAVENTFLGRKL